MKNLITILLLTISIGVFGQTTYRADTSGVEDFQTLAEINAFSFSYGDSLLFNRGDIFYGQLKLESQQGVTFGAYGTGADPIISGSKSLSGTWVEESTNIWYLVDNALPDNVRLLSINSVDKDFGKWPNVDWRLYDNPVLDEQFDDALGFPFTDNYFQNGEAVVGGSEYGFWIENYNIDSLIGDTYYIDGSFYNLFDGADHSYYVQNHPNTLDLQGEWSYNQDTVRVYSTGTLNDSLVEVANEDTTLIIDGCENIKLENIEITYSNELNAYVNNSDTIVFDGTLIQHGAFDGVHLSSCDSIVIKNSEIFDIGNNGLQISSDKVGILDNEIHSIGMDRGAGGEQGGKSVGIRIESGTGIDISYNEFYEIGYNGITLINYTCFNTTISYNYIHDYLLTKADGGGIYTWQLTANHDNGNIIDHNIVVDGNNGINQGMIVTGESGSTYPIYLDDRSDYITVSNNTCGTGQFSLYLHSNAVVTVTDNTLYGGNFCLYGFKDDNVTIEMDNITSSGNIMVHDEETSMGVYFKNMTDELNGGGVTFNNDYVIDPFNPRTTTNVVTEFNSNPPITDTDWTLWTSLFFTSNQTNAPVLSSEVPAVPDSSFVLFAYNPTKNDSTLSLAGLYLDIDSVEVSGDTTIAPYESVILFALDENDTCNFTVSYVSYPDTNNIGVGEIDLTVSGSENPYTYLWNDASTSNPNTGLSAGTYSVTITANNGCDTLISDITVTNYTSGSGNVYLDTVQVDFNQTGSDDGDWQGVDNITDEQFFDNGWSIQYNQIPSYSSTGGYIPNVYPDAQSLSYHWIASDVAPLIQTYSHLDTSKYYYYEELSARASATSYPQKRIIGNDTLYVDASDNTTLVKWYGLKPEADSTITIILDTTGSGSRVYTNAGMLIEYDSVQNPCDTTTIISTETVVNETNSQSNGSIALDVSGGVEPYTYLWSDASESNPNTGLSAGTYSVVITDDNGCTGSGGDYEVLNVITHKSTQFYPIGSKVYLNGTLIITGQ